jgi:hypothetical protein
VWRSHNYFNDIENNTYALGQRTSRCHHHAHPIYTEKRRIRHRNVNKKDSKKVFAVDVMLQKSVRWALGSTDSPILSTFQQGNTNWGQNSVSMESKLSGRCCGRFKRDLKVQAVVLSSQSTRVQVETHPRANWPITATPTFSARTASIFPPKSTSRSRPTRDPADVNNPRASLYRGPSHTITLAD